MKPLITAVLACLAVTAWAERADILPRPPRRPGPDTALVNLIHDTRVGDAAHFRNLVVYPLITEPLARAGYLTLSEALAQGQVRITEKGEGSVPELLVVNNGGRPVFLLAGEMVTGGKQNRVISQDILLAPHSGPISLGVFCVERGRWVRQTNQFGAEKELAHGNLRQQLAGPRVAQRQVWAEVSRKSAAVAGAGASPTEYLGKMYEDETVRRDLAEFTRRIRLPREANGMAVVIGGRVVGVELFGDPSLFGRLRDKLLRSYAVDAVEAPSAAKLVAGHESVERFLQRGARARLRARGTVGIGQLFAIEGGGPYGSVLAWHGQAGAHGVVHASLFDEEPVVTPAPDQPDPPRIRFGR
ncbi:hypothetical protein HQ590_01340 [bacterium]|nr:hypothetical protein [bacterium]